ncbi:enoyl-CoA hydratase [Tessaracoccus bendigoensis DSM 12906]|uniref:enoyl-CoA hydratase n=1 Tax=Tessaracoccus bendigoensis DSM 12906 TaxID=1123357 RepID=A0A1M6I3F6_9ACTN|nr:enoyl-CoA hydratase-related protein [Tessaracoccus bendigoensis]SHJ28922.1 enoyl-CoA hydratase [Tessaracoccus bendigoensis DSM 12906]
MSTVGYEALGQVARITVERPEALNALSTAVLLDLDEAISRATREAPRAVVLTGAGGKAFVAGADVAEMAGMSRLGAAAFGALGNRVFRALEQLPMPVIAAVNGFALGGGCELALACDLRIASETAVFAQPEVGLGITPGFGGTQRLARLIGPARAKELLFTARRVDASEALAIGLVNRVVAAEDLSDEALALADRIADQAPLAVRATKAAVDLGLQKDLDTALAIETAQFASCFETEDQTSAMGAFVERRKPEPFKGA